MDYNVCTLDWTHVLLELFAHTMTRYLFAHCSHIMHVTISIGQPRGLNNLYCLDLGEPLTAFHIDDSFAASW